MTNDLSQYSREDRERIARTARRSTTSEGALIWGAGGAVVALILAGTSMPWILQIAYRIGMSANAVWIVLSFSVTGLLALVHMHFSRPKILQARDLVASLHYAQQEKRRHEIDARMADRAKKLDAQE